MEQCIGLGSERSPFEIVDFGYNGVLGVNFNFSASLDHY